MKKSKIFISLILVVIIAIGSCGCMSNLSKSESEIQAEKAEELLYKKYGKEFVVDSLGGRWGTATDMFYTCACHPADDENFVFKATIAKDFSTLNDDYAKIIVQRNLTEGLEKELSDIDTSMTIFLEFDDNSGIEKKTTELNYKEFLQLEYAPLVYIAIGVTDDCLDELELRLNKLFENYLSGVDVRLYVLTESQKKEFDDWKKEHIYWNGLTEMLPKEVDREFYINFNVQ